MPVVRTRVAPRPGAARRPRAARTTGLKGFYDRRNRVLVLRGVGGLGDILMHRMLFADMKRVMPDAEIHFACPRYYHDAVADHPHIDRVLDSATVDRQDYVVHYNTTTACDRAEMRLAPFAGPHRSDLWAAACGLVLTAHDMHIRLTAEEQAEGRRVVEKYRDRPGPSVVVCPVSAMPTKNLTEPQTVGLIAGLRARGLYPLGLHSAPIWEFLKNDFPAHGERKIRRWMATLHAADYVVSVDTAAFHCASGMGKPLVGVFTAFDGKVYGKYADFFLVQRHRDDDPRWTCGPCYNWTACPKTRDPLKPCLTEITPEMILTQVDKMLLKWPRP